MKLRRKKGPAPADGYANDDSRLFVRETRMQPNPASEDPLREWLQENAPGLLTECMTLQKLADWFKVNRETMRTIVGHIPGVERCGKKFRIPVYKMPVGYWLEVGLIKPIDLPEIAGFGRS